MIRRIEAYADAGHGSQLLRRPELARVVQDALIHGHGRQYTLHNWVIMPTHVHMLLRPEAHATLAKIMQSIKGFSSKEIGRALQKSGRIWQPEYFDRAIRNVDQFARTAAYIEWNPVKAKLCVEPADWPFSSANLVAHERLAQVGVPVPLAGTGTEALTSPERPMEGEEDVGTATSNPG